MQSIEVKKQIDHISEVCAMVKPMVVIKTITYNHLPYIKDALDSFLEQRASFPFVVVVHDDVSTDGTVEVIREYAEKYPDTILPIFETENQYSKPGGVLGIIMSAAAIATGAKYVAMCEGDDYWIDPLKLQKQVDAMEANPDYSMCVTNAYGVRAADKSIRCEFKPMPQQGVIPFERLVRGGGGIMATCTFMYRRELFDKRPDEMKTLYVGDYPLQIYMGYVGKVYFINEITACYRMGSIGSFMSRNVNTSFEKRKKLWPLQFQIYDVFDKITKSQYSELFSNAKKEFIFDEYLRYKKYGEARRLWVKLDHPLRRYGMTVFFKIFGLGKAYSFAKKLIGRK